MAKLSKAEKKAKKAEKKANRNPEITKTVISSITAIACVIAVVATSLSITDKVCETNKTLASNNNGATSDTGTEDPFGDVFGDDTATADPTADPAAADDSTADPAAADDSAADDSAVNNGSSSNGGSSSSKGGTTADSPVGTDVNKIVAYYNEVANATKAYKGKMVIKAKQGATTKITDTTFPSAAMNIANGMLPNDFPTDGSYNRNYTVTNGQATDGKSIQKILPIDGDAKMSKLTAAGVQTAKCAKTGNGYTIQLKLKPESVNSFDKLPANHSSCMDCLNMSSKDLEPFTCENCTINYTGATLIAVVNDKGMLTEFKVYNPMHITGTLKWTAIKGEATIDASWRQEVVISY